MLNDRIKDKNISTSLKLIILSIMKIVGCEVSLNNPSEFDEVIWEINSESAMNLKTHIEQF